MRLGHWGSVLRWSGGQQRRVPEIGVLAVVRPETPREYKALASLLTDASQFAGKNKIFTAAKLRKVRQRYLPDKPTP